MEKFDFGTMNFATFGRVDMEFGVIFKSRTFSNKFADLQIMDLTVPIILCDPGDIGHYVYL